MPRGGQRDLRETFLVDTLRLRNKGEPPPAPQKGALELYFKEKILYRMEDNGVETPIGGFGASASPGFTWGRKGTVGTGAYLMNDDVPSNVTGRLVTFARPVIKKILVTNGSVSTFDITVQEHDGVTYTNLATISVVADREAVASLSVPVTSGMQLAVQVTAGTADNPVVGIILDGLY